MIASMRCFESRCLLLVCWLALAGLWPARANAATNLFTNQFEAAEGYNGLFTLVGQKGHRQ